MADHDKSLRPITVQLPCISLYLKACLSVPDFCLASGWFTVMLLSFFWITFLKWQSLGLEKKLSSSTINWSDVAFFSWSTSQLNYNFLDKLLCNKPSLTSDPFVLYRTMRNKWGSCRSSLPWCTTRSRGGWSSSTWTAWWTTRWRCTKLGSSWTFGRNTRGKSLRRSESVFNYYPGFTKSQRWEFGLDEWWMHLPCRFIQHPKNFGLIASYLERKVNVKFIIWINTSWK